MISFVFLALTSYYCQQMLLHSNPDIPVSIISPAASSIALADPLTAGADSSTVVELTDTTISASTTSTSTTRVSFQELAGSSTTTSDTLKLLADSMLTRP